VDLRLETPLVHARLGLQDMVGLVGLLELELGVLKDLLVRLKVGFEAPVVLREFLDEDVGIAQVFMGFVKLVHDHSQVVPGID
jgi:hypothetical protein